MDNILTWLSCTTLLTFISSTSHSINCHTINIIYSTYHNISIHAIIYVIIM